MFLLGDSIIKADTGLDVLTRWLHYNSRHWIGCSYYVTPL